MQPDLLQVRIQELLRIERANAALEQACIIFCAGLCCRQPFLSTGQTIRAEEIPIFNEGNPQQYIEPGNGDLTVFMRSDCGHLSESGMCGCYEDRYQSCRGLAPAGVVCNIIRVAYGLPPLMNNKDGTVSIDPEFSEVFHKFMRSPDQEIIDSEWYAELLTSLVNNGGEIVRENLAELFKPVYESKKLQANT